LLRDCGGVVGIRERADRVIRDSVGGQCALAIRAAPTGGARQSYRGVVGALTVRALDRCG
jgi:hypothetical protein